MQRYLDTLTRRVGDALVPISGASIQVNDRSSGGAATLYSDNGVTTVANPRTSDSEGRFYFYAADGRYDLTISGTGFEPYTLEDIVLDDPQPLASVAALLAYPDEGLDDGDQMEILSYYAGTPGGGQTVYWDADATDAHNGGTVFLPTGRLTAGRWKSVDTSIVTAKQFGAKGDGVTNDSSPVQALLDYVETTGGNVDFEKGKYFFTTKVTLDRTYGASGSDLIGERNLVISGYGAELLTNGAIPALEIKGGWSPNRNCTVEGFTINHRNNSTATAGISCVGAGMVTLREISVAVSSSLPSGYAAFSFANTTTSDPDTGSFLCLIDGCVVRPWAGADGYCDYGVLAQGATNALTITRSTFSGSTTHVLLKPHSGQTYSPNSVNIDGNFFEGPTSATAVELNGTAVTYHVSGCRITNNRFESLTNAIKLSGTGTTVQVPTYIAGNYSDTSVTNHLVNSLSIPVVLLDSEVVGAPIGPMILGNNAGLEVQTEDGTKDALTLKTSKGILLKRRSDGADLASWRYASSVAGGIGSIIGGSYSTYRPFVIKGCQGIAARDTTSNNLAGTATFSASTTVAVTFPVAESDANYLILYDSPANQYMWTTSKSTTGFTINSSASNSNTVGWVLIRHL